MRLLCYTVMKSGNISSERTKPRNGFVLMPFRGPDVNVPPMAVVCRWLLCRFSALFYLPVSDGSLTAVEVDAYLGYGQPAEGEA